MSRASDAYQPIERRLQLTRRCLEVFQEFRNPVAIVTKSQLVARDADILSRLADYNAAAVFVSVTTLDNDLARIMEPRATQPAGRLAAISTMAQAGVPVGVLAAPIILGLNDHELPAIIQAAAAAGAGYASYIMLRLPYGVGPLFDQWLDQHFPNQKEKILNRVRELRGGRLNDHRFKSRMRGEGIWAEVVKNVYDVACRQAGIAGKRFQLSSASFQKPGPKQRLLFE